MAINKKLIHFNTKANFDKELTNGNILDTSICFIKDEKKIWTHGEFYDGNEILEPDEQDLTINSDGKLLLKDRTFKSAISQGYYIIRGLEDISKFTGVDNSIFEIQTKIDLKGSTLNLPLYSILKFNGGYFYNGTLKGNRTTIETPGNLIGGGIRYFLNISFTGKFTNGIIRPEWFGAYNDGLSGSSESFRKAIEFANCVTIPDDYKSGSAESYSHGNTATILLNGGTYVLDSRISLTYENLDGLGATIKADSSSFTDACLIYTNVAFCGTIKNLTIDGSMRLTRGISGPMRKGTVLNVNIRDCLGYGIYNNGGFECTYSKVHIGIYGSIPSYITDYSKIIGFYTTASDSCIDNMIVVNYPIGLKFDNSGWQVNNVHVWGKPTDGTVPHIGAYVAHENISINHFYADTVLRQDPTKEWDATVNGSINGGIGVYIHNTSTGSSGKRTIVRDTTAFVNASLFNADLQNSYKGKLYIVLAKVYDNVQHPQVEGLNLASKDYYDLNNLVNLVNRGNYQRPNTDLLYDGYMWINPENNLPLFKCSAVGSKWVDSSGNEHLFTSNTLTSLSVVKTTLGIYDNITNKNANTLYIVE